MLCRLLTCLIAGISTITAAAPPADVPPAERRPVEHGPDYARDVQPLLTKYCAGCHNADEANGEFAVQNFAALGRGGEHGAAFVAGKPDESRLIRLVERTDDPAMPPEDEPAPTPTEIALLRAWIAAGAPGPAGVTAPLSVPTITPTAPVRRSVHAAVWSPDGQTLAVGRYGSVELWNADQVDAAGTPTRTLAGPAGHVNGLAFTPDGATLLAAGGAAGLAGEVVAFDIASGERRWTAAGHRDAVTAAALAPDGRVLATGSYDQTIRLWDVASGTELRLLTGHNGPVYGLAFHPTQPLLASASGDRTVKLWNPTTGARLDTLTEPTKDQHAIAFSPDGGHLAAGGADNRVRIWGVAQGEAGTTPLLHAQFAHEAPLLALAYSGDGQVLVTAGQDRTVKFWNAAEMSQLAEPMPQPDWVAALALAHRHAVLGRMDGSLADVPLPNVPLPNNVPAASGARQPAGQAGAASDQQPSSSHTPVVALRPGERDILEAEPNDDAHTATPLPLPGQATGVLQSAGDADCYRIAAVAGQTWILETNAAQSGSPADTILDVLHADGTPVERMRLRAVRDSAINFRGMNADNLGVRLDNWQEMELRDYVYFSGEVARIFRMPQGPDSDFLLTSLGGKRHSYFDTTAFGHAKDDPAYIVRPLPPGASPPDNGLPVFSVAYQNDDDAARQIGRDSRLTFTAPADGDYIVRVRDVRGFGGSDYRYTLSARQPVPGFTVRLKEKTREVPAGSGQDVTLIVQRRDGFAGRVTVTFEGLPVGLQMSSPVVIEAEQEEAHAVLTATSGAPAPSETAAAALQVLATADVEGQTVTQTVASLSKLTLGPPPKLRVTLRPTQPGEEITIRPGGHADSLLTIERNGFDGEMKFEVENLPHGVIVDHIGLSGVLVRNGETSRRVELTCADWVAPTTRLVFAVSLGEGGQASVPVLLRVLPRQDVAQNNATE